MWMIEVRDRRDKVAFSRLFDFFAPRLKAAVMRSGAASAQAEEIVQDVMLTVWRKAGLFDPERAQVSAWVYQIALNRQIDVMRKEGRPMPEEITREGEAEPDASRVLAVEQEALQLRDAMERLTPEQRGVIERAYFGEMTHQDIREETGLPLGTIKSRIRLGLERLRHELKGLREE
ncbi:MAG: sigma-70 family RNA polymerase sigma factor [Pseudomonadota bacterium]